MASPPLSSNCTGSGAPCPAAPPTSWPTSTGPAPPTAPPKRSTADSNTSAAPPSASATSPTTSPDHSSKQAASAPPYTAKCDEPLKFVPPDDEHSGRADAIRKARRDGLELARLNRLANHRHARETEPIQGPGNDA